MVGLLLNIFQNPLGAMSDCQLKAGVQCGGCDRFGTIQVRPALQALNVVAAHGVGGEHYDEGLVTLAQRASQPCDGFQATHIWPAYKEYDK